MVERIGEDNVFVHLDTYHMNIEEKGFDEAIVEAGRHLRYIHLSESDRGVPGTGTVDWDSVFRGLARVGTAGALVVESFLTLHPCIARALDVDRERASQGNGGTVRVDTGSDRVIK